MCVNPIWLSPKKKSNVNNLQGGGLNENLALRRIEVYVILLTYQNCDVWNRFIQATRCQPRVCFVVAESPSTCFRKTKKCLKSAKYTYVPALHISLQVKDTTLSCRESVGLYHSCCTNAMIVILTLVQHKKSRFDNKMHGSTQKSPVRNKMPGFRHINAIPSMHQLTLPLSNTVPPPVRNIFSNFIKIFCF